MKAFTCIFLICGLLGAANSATLTITDKDVLNFALQLEYLSASFWTAAATGNNLTDALLGGGGPIIGGQKAILQGSALDMATEFAANGVAHVNYLRTLLADEALPAPEIDIGTAFADFMNLTLASLENYNPYAPFTPYYSFYHMYMAGFMISDPSVFSYIGVSSLISNGTLLDDFAGLLATKGYEAGSVRFNLATIGTMPTPYGLNVTVATDALAAVRAVLQGSQTDYGIADRTGSTLTNADSSSLTFSRTIQQTLAFFYQSGSPVIPGGWFPKGINGIFSPTSLSNLANN